MDPIRPNLPPVVPPNGAPKSPDATRSAAQKAFFDIALGKTPPPAAAPQAVAQAAPKRAAAPVKSPTQTAGETAPRPLRPGSILDIRV